jgi:transcriptional regulator with XRE-family HTH domain
LSTASSIGERLRAVRVRAGLAQTAFGEALGYSRRAVINWEQNAAEPSISMLDKLCRLFDVDPKWVVMGEDLTPCARYGSTDWARFDRIANEVKAACTQIGVGFEDEVHVELVRDLFDDDPGDDETNRKQLHRTLRAIARGRAK